MILSRACAFSRFWVPLAGTRDRNFEDNLSKGNCESILVSRSAGWHVDVLACHCQGDTDSIQIRFGLRKLRGLQRNPGSSASQDTSRAVTERVQCVSLGRKVLAVQVQVSVTERVFFRPSLRHHVLWFVTQLRVV